MRRPALTRALLAVAALVVLLGLVSARVALLARPAVAGDGSTPLTENQLDALQKAAENRRIFFFSSRAATDRLLREHQLRRSLGRSDAEKPLLALQRALAATRSILGTDTRLKADVGTRLMEAGFPGAPASAGRPFPPQRLLSLILLGIWVGAVLVFIFRGLTPGLALRPRWAARSALAYAVFFTLWVLAIRGTA